MDTEDMKTALLADVLMLRGETRHCSDCGTSTVFLPVDEHAWVCTACDAAVLVTPVITAA